MPFTHSTHLRVHRGGGGEDNNHPRQQQQTKEQELKANKFNLYSSFVLIVHSSLFTQMQHRIVVAAP